MNNVVTTEEKPTLNFSEEVIRSVDYYCLQEFIEKVTGYDYDFINVEEWSNDSQHRFNVKKFYSDYDMKYSIPDWEGFKKTGKGVRGLSTIMCGLATDGFIPEGIYLVMVCW